MAAVKAAIPRAERDGTRPVYHFRPPAQWMNDPVGIVFHKGFYHVFYEFNPFADTWGATGTYWGHTRSRDLVHWEHLPIAFGPSIDLGERRCNSGCLAFNDSGTPVIFYTMVPFEGRREHWAVLGDDELNRWVEYFVGSFDVDTLKFTTEKHGILDYSYGPEHPNFWSRGLYATYTFSSPDERCMMLGWVSGFKRGRGWHGCLSLPRVLSLDKEQNLIQSPACELSRRIGSRRFGLCRERQRFGEIG